MRGTERETGGRNLYNAQKPNAPAKTLNASVTQIPSDLARPPSHVHRQKCTSSQPSTPPTKPVRNTKHVFVSSAHERELQPTAVSPGRHSRPSGSVRWSSAGSCCLTRGKVGTILPRRLTHGRHFTTDALRSSQLAQCVCFLGSSKI